MTPGYLRRAPTWFSALAVLALTVVYFWPVLAARRFMAGDMLAETYPFRRYVTQELFMGRLPHWAPHVGFGFPLLADPEATVFYPMSLVSSLLAGPEFSFRHLQWEIIAHYVVAALGMAFLGLRTNLGWAGALVGAYTFAFTGFLWGHGGHASIVQSACWLPWILLGAAALLERPGTRAAVGTGAVLALSILGGHPQIAYYGGLAFAIVVAVVGWPFVTREAAGAKARPAWGLVGGAALAVVLAGGLAAIQVLPTAALTRESIRWHRDEGFLHAGELPLEHLLKALVPLAFEGTRLRGSMGETHFYVGILPLVLAAWALVRRRDRWTVAFAAIAALGLLTALDVRPARWIGTGGFFRIPARAVLLFDLGVAALAARGADALCRSAVAPTRGERHLLRALGGLVGVIGVAAASLLIGGVPARLSPFLAKDFAGQFLWMAGALAVATLTLVVARRLRRPTWAAPALVLGLLVLEILAFPRDLVWSPRGPERRWPRLATIDALAAQAGTYRVGGDLYGFARTTENNAGLVYRVPLGAVYSSLSFRRIGPVLDLLGSPPGLDAYRLAGIRWVASTAPPAQRWPDRGSLRALQPAGPQLWTVPDALPRAYLPAETRLIPGIHERVRALATLNPRRTVLVERHTGECPERALGDEGAVEFLADQPRRVLLRVRAREPGPLVLSDAYYLGWEATIDGTPVRIHRANQAFRLVCVPAGEHRVEFTFQQPGFRLGAAVTILSGAVALALALGPGALALRRGVRPRLRAPARTRP